MKIKDDFWVLYSEEEKRIWSYEDITSLEYPTLYPSLELAEKALELSYLRCSSTYEIKKVKSMTLQCVSCSMGFKKCCSCGLIDGDGTDPSERELPRSCDCKGKVLAYYPECPQCKRNGIPISYCSFCTNSQYGSSEYKYENGYVSRRGER